MTVQLIYEGKDITQDIEIGKADLTDNAGGQLDSIDLLINDPKGLWSQWKPQKNHTVQLKESGFDSGLMYVDEIGQQRGVVVIRALPVKQEAKTPNIKAWDKVRLLEIAQELAGKQGLQLQTFGAQNHYYERVDQNGLADPEFLAWRCLLEGYALKVSGGKLIIYSEKYMEGQIPVKTITPDDVDGNFDFKNRSTGIFGSCKISYQDIQYEFKAPGVFGPALKYFDVAMASLGEAERFAKGLLRAKNKFEQTFICTVKLDPGIAAGNTISLKEFGLADGKYFAYQVIHRLSDEKTLLKLRKPLEGY